MGTDENDSSLMYLELIHQCSIFTKNINVQYQLRKVTSGLVFRALPLWTVPIQSQIDRSYVVILFVQPEFEILPHPTLNILIIDLAECLLEVNKGSACLLTLPIDCTDRSYRNMDTIVCSGALIRLSSPDLDTVISD